MAQPPALPFATDPQLLHALEQGVAWVDRTDRSRLHVTGPDRAKLLHNLTTNDLRRLPAGQGCEAFVTSLQGKTLGFVVALVGDDRIVIRSDAGALAGLLPHFQKYGALEDVAVQDQSDQSFEYHLLGPQAGPLLTSLGAQLPPTDDFAHHATTLAGHPILLVRETPTVDPGLTVIGETQDEPAIAQAITQAGPGFGLVRMAPDQFDALRIEAGTPVYGRDVTEANLPQELDRDRRAISFTKGCYLGQETVARLDALGHVNKILRGLIFESATPPPPGSALARDGKPAGTVTSAAASVRGGTAIGLAMIRVAHAEIGTALVCQYDGVEIAARVAAFPLR